MKSSPAILGVGTANPPRRYTQQALYEVAARYSDFYRSERIRQIFMNSDIDSRYLYIDFDTTVPEESPDELHERYARGAVEIASQAAERCLEQAGLGTGEIDAIIAVSCTGYLCPGLSSLLIRRLGMRTNMQRADLLGMGCAGALPGLQRAYDFATAYPGKKALLVTVEICSACYYVDESLETVVGNAICSDGAAAVVVGLSSDPRVPKILGFETLLDPSLIDSVGFQQRGGKLRIVLSKDIRTVAGSLAKDLLQALFASYHLRPDAVTHWVLHSGGRKVIDNIQREMSLSDHQVRHSKRVLRNYGNMSSPTVLFVLQEMMRDAHPAPGDLGVMLAMGPGLAIEGALLSW